MVVRPEQVDTMAPERKVPITKSDFHVLDEEFSSMRDRFQGEMKKMEEEMSRLRSQLKDNDPSTSSSSTGRTSSPKPTPFSSTSSASIRMSSSTTSSEESSSHKASSSIPDSTWLDDITSPLIQDTEGGGKVLKLRFDVSEYSPEEILVKTVDNKLKVNAKHEEKTENKSVYREYNREFVMPKGVDPEQIRSSLSKDGILSIEAPIPVMANGKERTIPIDKF